MIFYIVISRRVYPTQKELINIRLEYNNIECICPCFQVALHTFINSLAQIHVYKASFQFYSKILSIQIIMQGISIYCTFYYVSIEIFTRFVGQEQQIVL